MFRSQGQGTGQGPTDTREENQLATKLEEARQLLVKRLEEIDREREQLVAAITQLEGVVESKSAAASPARRSSRRSRGSTKPRRSNSSNGRRKRAPRGKREEQLLSSITAHPDFRVADHAREVGVKPQQLYPILNRLLEREAITKKDDKYVLKSA